MDLDMRGGAGQGPSFEITFAAARCSTKVSLSGTRNSGLMRHYATYGMLFDGSHIR